MTLVRLDRINEQLVLINEEDRASLKYSYAQGEMHLFGGEGVTLSIIS